MGVCLLSHWSVDPATESEEQVLIWTSGNKKCLFVPYESVRNRLLKCTQNVCLAGSLFCVWEKGKVKKQTNKQNPSTNWTFVLHALDPSRSLLRGHRVVTAVTTDRPGVRIWLPRASRAYDLPPLSRFFISERGILLLPSWVLWRAGQMMVVKCSMPRLLSLILMAAPEWGANALPGGEETALSKPQLTLTW